MSEWMESELFEAGHLMATDAMGSAIDNVETARQTEDGIEVIAMAVTPEGDELVCSYDGGITLDPVRARMEIPGGMIHDMTEED